MSWDNRRNFFEAMSRHFSTSPDQELAMISLFLILLLFCASRAHEKRSEILFGARLLQQFPKILHGLMTSRRYVRPLTSEIRWPSKILNWNLVSKIHHRNLDPEKIYVKTIQKRISVGCTSMSVFPHKNVVSIHKCI